LIHFSRWLVQSGIAHARIDRFTSVLSAVPEAEQCGWVKDHFGVSWQIVPRQLTTLNLFYVIFKATSS
jgi:predicted 3-demethylubiquinone-9 3-methyltransferase (glyoxalase superfamily)